MNSTQTKQKLYTLDYYRGQRYVVTATIDGFLIGHVEIPRTLTEDTYKELECHGGIIGETRYISPANIEASENCKFIVFHTGHEGDLPHITTIEDCFEDDPNLDNYITEASKKLLSLIEKYNEYREEDIKPRAITPEEVISDCCSIIDQLEQLGTYSL